MDINDLKAKGAFVQVPPVPVEVSWTHDGNDGEKVTDTFIVHVRRMSVGWLDRVFARSRGNPDASRTAALISEGVRFGENGTEKLSYEEACQLDFDLGNALVAAFDRVNRDGDGTSKNSQPPTSSGTN